MNYTGYSVLEIPKTGAAFSYAKEARDFATGATGVGGYLNSTAVSNSWTDVRFVSAIREGSSSLPVSIGATETNLYTGVSTIIGGSTPIGDLRSEDGPYVGVGTSSVYYTKKGQEYGAAFYATYIGGTNSAPTKIGIGTTSTDISTSGYYEGSFTTREIYEFETSFTPDLDDLTKTITGSGVYKNGDSVSLQFNILNRNGELLTSAAQIAADPFIDKQVISILDVDSNVVFPNYRDNGDSTFTFSRSQNIDVFGTYTRNFGVRNEIVNKNGLTSTGEFYLYGNTTTFDNILVQASGETVLNENLSNHSPPDTGSITSAADRADAIKYFNNQPVNTSGSTGFIELSLAFNEDPTFTEYSNLNIWASDTENFDSNIGNFIGSFPLDFSQEGQTIRLTPDNGIQDGTGLFFKLAVESSVEFEKEVFNLGPFTIEPIIEGPDLNLYNQGDQSMVGDFTIEGGLEGDSANGGNLNVSGNALGTGIGGRLTGPESKMYLLSGDAGTESDTLQSVTFRGQSTDVGLSLIGSTPLSFDGTEGVPQTDKSIYYDNSDESLYFGHGITTIKTDIAGGGAIGTTLRLFPSHSVTVGADGIIVGSSPATGSAILGGQSGIISGHYSTIVGGFSNRVSGSNFGFIGGGSGIEVVDSVYSSSIGGYNNDISGSAYSVIGGGQDNLIASGNKNFIGGGSSNTISGSQAVVSAILGGENNLITGLNSVLLGGNSNEILSNYSFIGGGEENITSGAFSAISAGESNKTFGLHSIIAGGQENIASGTHSFIGGGHLNTASANYSYAFGRRSKVGIYDTGAAVFSDGRDEDSISSGAHTATLDFAGGVYVPTSGMFGEGLFVSGVPVLTGEINPPEVDTLQTVTTRGNETTTSIISTGPYISGVTGLFSSNVGIGTTSPNGKLDVRQTANSGRTLVLGNTAASVAGDIDGQIVFTKHPAFYDSWKLYSKNTNAGNGRADLYLDSYATTSTFKNNVTFLNNGNVGIGTTSPSNKLTVEDTIGIKRSGVAAITTLQQNGSGLILNAPAGYHPFIIRANGVEQVRFANTGNVGIGTTNPQAALHVAGAIPIAPTGSGVLMGLQSNYAIIHLNGSTGGILEFSSSGVDRKGRILYDNNSNYMQIQTNGSDKVRIDSAGKVGIGTVSPATILDLDDGTVSDIRIRGNATTDVRFAGIAFYNTAGSDTVAAVNVDRDGANDAGALTFDTQPAGGGNTERLRISSTGAIKFNTYGAGTFTGTVTQKLGVDSSGNVIEMPIGAGPVDGSGTANYLARWIDSDTLGIGAAYDNGTNVGIGTTSPASVLHVSGGSATIPTLSASHPFTISNTSNSGMSIISGGTTNAGQIVFGDSNDADVGRIRYQHSDNSLRFWTNADERVRIDSAGNVGIGTTAPQTELEISAAQSPFLRLTSEKDGAHDAGDIYGELQFFTQETYGNAPVVSAKIQSLHTRAGTGHTNGDAGLAFFTSTATNDATATERMRIESATGNVGIGITSPAEKFHVSNGASGFSGTHNVRTQAIIESDNSSGTALAIMSKNTGNSAIWFGDQNSETVGQVYYNHPSNYLAFGASGATQAVVNSTGLGIGTTSPNFKLEVVGDSTSGILAVRNAANARDTFRSENAAGTRTFNIGNDASGHGIILIRNSGGTTTNYITGSGNSYFNAGNVGIGTNVPVAKLDVSTTGADGINLSKDTAASTISSRLFFSNATAGQGVSIYNSGSNMRFQTGSTVGSSTGTTRMVINSNGRVGIGTNAPSSLLHLEDASSPTLQIKDTTQGTTLKAFSQDSNAHLGTFSNHPLVFDTNSSERMRIDTSGNVTIGNTNASAKLDIRQDTGYALRTENASGYTFRVEADTGNIEAAGSIKMADDTDTASASKVGTMRYRTGTEYVDVDGVELVTNGDFDSATGWNLNSNWSISGGTCNADGTSNADINQNLVLGVVGQNYRITYVISAYTQGSIAARIGSGITDYNTGTGTFTQVVTATTTDRIRMNITSNFIGSVDSLSIVKVTEEDASYADMCMQTAASTYEWVNIVRNSY